MVVLPSLSDLLAARAESRESRVEMNRADESDDDEEDPVVREFDVYVTDMAHL